MNNEWKKLREEGLTYKAIAEKYNVSKQAVFDALDKAGTPRRTKYSQYYEEWETLYKSGLSTYEIAEKYNCDRKTIHNYLSKKLVINASEAAMRGWKKRKQRQKSETISLIG